MALTRQAIESTRKLGGADGKLLHELEFLFPCTPPPKEVIQSTREQMPWHNPNAKSRKVEKTDKLVSKRMAIYYGHLNSIISRKNRLVNPQKSYDQNLAAVKGAVMAMYNEVAAPKDGKGEDVTEKKPYIGKLMSHPSDASFTDLLRCIQQCQDPDCVFVESPTKTVLVLEPSR